MNVSFEREIRKLCKDLEWEEVVLVLLGVLDGINGEVYDDFKMSIEQYKDDKKKKEVKETRTFKGKPLKYAENGFVKTYCIKNEEK